MLSRFDRAALHFGLERLETRRLLAITASVGSNSTLNIIGDGGNNSIVVNKLSNGKVNINGGGTQFTPGSGGGKFNKINIDAKGGNDTVQINNNVPYNSATIAGGTGNDNLKGGVGNDLVSGNAGNDTLSGGGGGADVTTGGSNFDTTNYSDRTDNLTISLDGNANDGANGGSEGDNVQTEEVICGSGKDTVTGSSSDDFIAGGGGNDSINGNGGNDEITGGSGQDKLLGATGDDFIQAKNSDQDTVGGGEEADGADDFDLASVDGIDVPAVGGLATLKTIEQNLQYAHARAQQLDAGSPSDLDPEYGDGGLALVLAEWDSINATAVDSLGRVIFVGSKFGGYGSDMVVARFNEDGSFDDEFGGDGEAVIDFGGFGYGNEADDYANGVTTLEDNSIIVVGSTDPSDSESFQDSDFAVAKLTENGFLDEGFGNNGKRIIDIGEDVDPFNDAAYDVVIQTDGKIVVAGDHARAFPEVSYDPAGDFSPDNNPNDFWSYGFSDTLTDPFTLYDTPETDDNQLDYWTASQRESTLTFAPDVVHNGTGDDAGGLPDGFLGLDPGFYGEVSYVRFTAPTAGTYDILGSFDSAFFDIESRATTDVHVLVKGESQFDGELTGGEGGVTSESFELNGFFLNPGDTVDFAVGYGSNQNFNNDTTGLSAEIIRTSAPDDQAFAVARLTSGGDVDSTFNFGEGYNTLVVGGFTHASSVALQTLPDDFDEQRIVVGGSADGNFVVARFLSDGAVDFGFGDNNGFTATDIGFAGHLRDLAVNSDNVIYAVGSINNSTDSFLTRGFFGDEAVLARYDADGFFDGNITEPGNGSASYNAITIDELGRLVVAGDDEHDYFVGRYNDLTFDSTFAPDGPIHTNFLDPETNEASLTDAALGLRVLDSNKIVVGGYSGFFGDGQTLYYSAARYMGDQEAENPFDIEQFVDINNPPPELTERLNDLSDGARIYILSVPDDDGNLKIDLTGIGDVVTLSTVFIEGVEHVAININGIINTFEKSTLNSIKINGGDGPDKIIADSSVTTTLLLVGQGGDDTLGGGGGRNLLFGQAGNDVMDGGPIGDIVAGGAGKDKTNGQGGNDIVIGGPNNDTATGGSGEDIVIAGFTSYDNDIPALTALLDEWTSANTRSVRISNLRDGSGANAPFYLDGSGSDRTVFDDIAKDSLTGNSGLDWFFRRNSGSNADSVTDGSAGETFDFI